MKTLEGNTAVDLAILPNLQLVFAFPATFKYLTEDVYSAGIVSTHHHIQMGQDKLCALLACTVNKNMKMII